MWIDNSHITFKIRDLKRNEILMKSLMMKIGMMKLFFQKVTFLTLYFESKKREIMKSQKCKSGLKLLLSKIKMILTNFLRILRLVFLSMIQRRLVMVKVKRSPPNHIFSKLQSRKCKKIKKFKI